MARGANGMQSGKPEDGHLDPYYRLIELQKQMIDLIQQNANAKRECAALREQLAREVEALARSRRSLPNRLRESAAGLVKRLFRRNGHEPQNARGASVAGWSQPLVERNSSATVQRASVNS